MLTPGMTVNVYQKPLTDEEYEGTAELLENLNPDEGDGLSRWKVRFPDGIITSRTINIANALCNNHQKASIYSDPFDKTQENYEGIASLLLQICPVDNDGFSTWWVRFIDGKEIRMRIVHEDDILENQLDEDLYY